MKLIPLGTTNRAKHKGFAMVDDEDYDFLMKFKWYCTKTKLGGCYATRYDNKLKKNYSMHRTILNVTQRDVLVDHKDFNGLNNQKSNMLCDYCIEWHKLELERILTPKKGWR